MIPDMKLLIALVPFLAFAQPTLSVVGAPVRAGQTASVNVSLSGSAGQSVAAIQFSTNLPASATVTAADASTAAAKQLTCGQNAAGLSTCVLVGINANVYADGNIATISFPTAGPNPFTASSAQGPAIALSNTAAASLAGQGVTLSAGAAYTQLLLSPCDLNGDGKTDIADIQAGVSQLETGVGSIQPIAGGSSFGIVDVQRIVNAAVSGSCATGSAPPIVPLSPAAK